MAIPSALCVITASAVPAVLLLGVGIGNIIGHVVDQVAPPEPPLPTRRWVLLSLLVAIICVVLVCLDYGSRRRQEEPSYEAFREQIHRNMVKRSPSFPTPSSQQQQQKPMIGDIASQIIDTYDS